MTVAHKDLTGVDLHEPKGVATATANQIYRADGSGSGSWQTLSLPTGTHRVAFTTFTASGTWTKPANLQKVRVHCVGSGADGTGVTDGGSVSFGAHLSATGGLVVNTAGTGSGGDINLTGDTYDVTDRPTAYGAGPWSPKGNSVGAGGVAAGGYSVKEILTSSLGATEAVVFSTALGANNGFCVIEETITT